MRPRRPVPAVLVLATGTAMLVSGCGSQRAAADGTGPSAPTSAPASASPTPPAPDARAQLAGLVAAAKDRRMTAGYTLTRANQPVRSITVTLATDGSWRVDLPGGALGGAADIAVVGAKGNLYQCPLSITGTTTRPSCVRVAGLDAAPPAAVDPRVQHFFTDWLDVLSDRRAALSVATATLLPGARGTCFSVDSNSASLAPQVDAGIYCYDADGTLTAVRTTTASMVLAGQPGAAPQSVQLPGPIVSGVPLPTTSPAAPASAGRPGPSGSGTSAQGAGQGQGLGRGGKPGAGTPRPPTGAATPPGR